MSRLRYLVTAAFAVAAASPSLAQDAAPAATAVVPMVASDTAVDSFYSAHNQAPLWLRDASSREAATKLSGFLRRAPLDGLPEGPELAAGIEAALASGQPADDRIISAAWVRYVQALRRPVDGMSYGDTALAPDAGSVSEILVKAEAASSLAAHVEEVASVNPLYSALREAAAKAGGDPDARVKASLDRLRLVPAKGRAILVDSANAELLMLQDGEVLGTMKVIVGKTSAPTPLLAGTIHYVTFNPYWHIVDEVARRRVAPAVLKRGVSYLKAARYEVTSDWSSSSEAVDPTTIDWKGVAAGTEQVFIRQLPGEQNQMGAVKFSFENKEDIFLHDTPHKELFKKAKRTLSLGCVRLEQADRLATWLLGRDAAPPGDAPEMHVQLDKGVPVYLIYLTATVRDGQLAFADDVYAIDTPAEAPKAIASAAD
jgi:murein L,D-transpeptidase YcbB/YkuD